MPGARGLQASLRARVAGIYDNDGMLANLRPGTLDAWIFHPLYERETRNWLAANLQHRSGVMIDVGAHCGSFSLRHRSSFEKVLALEPNAADYSALVTNVQLSGASEVVPVNKAASDASGPVRLYLGTPGTHSLLESSRGAYLDVEATTLDDLVDGYGAGFSEIRLIKIDVEGAELNVLRGSRKILSEGAPLIVAEANTAHHAEELTHFLNPLGYVDVATTDVRNMIFRKSS